MESNRLISMNLDKYLLGLESGIQKPALVMGSAPSVSLVSKMDIDAIKIGVGDLPWRAPRLGPYDYWVTANSYYPLPWKKSHLKDIKKTNAKLLLSTTSVVNVPEEHIFKTLIDLKHIVDDEKIIIYDQRHSNNALCNPLRNCCELQNFFSVGPTIQEILNSRVNLNTPGYSEGSTSALHGFALAILLKCNPIYLVGIELPKLASKYKHYNNLKINRDLQITKIFAKKNFYNYVPIIKPTTPGFDNIFEGVKSDFLLMKAISARLGIRVITFNDVLN